MNPAEAMRGFLEALGVPAPRIPLGFDAQVGLYRSLLAGRRVLVVLDNARDVDQVRPLLPGAAGCRVVVTSRNRLSSLVAKEGARPLVAGRALRGRGARAAGRPARAETGWPPSHGRPTGSSRAAPGCRWPWSSWRLGPRPTPASRSRALAAELRDAQGDLDVFDDGSADTDVRAVFSWSYQALGPAAGRLFRLLGLHPGPDVDGRGRREPRRHPGDSRPRGCWPNSPAPTCSSSPRRAGSPSTTCSAPTPPSWPRARTPRPNDAPRPAGCSTTTCTPRGRRRCCSTRSGTRSPWPRRSPDVTPEAIADPAPPGSPRSSRCCSRPSGARPRAGSPPTPGSWPGPRPTSSTAAGTGTSWPRPSGSRWRRPAARRTWPGRPAPTTASPEPAAGWATTPQAHAHLELALDLHRALGDPVSQAYTHRGLAATYEWQGSNADALGHDQQALELYRQAGHLPGQASALNSIGWCHAQLGDYAQALVCCQQALALHRSTANRHGQASTLDSLGYVHHRVGDPARAAACYEQALELFRALGDRFYEADTLTHLGDAWQAAGDEDVARQAWRDALRILAELRHPDAAAVQARLRPEPAQTVLPRQRVQLTGTV